MKIELICLPALKISIEKNQSEYELGKRQVYGSHKKRVWKIWHSQAVLKVKGARGK